MNGDQQQAPMVFTLTDLIGKHSGRDRTVVIATIEVPRHYARIALVALIPSILVMVLLAPLLKLWSLLVVGLVEGLAFFLYERRVSSGLKVRTYQRIVDNQKSSHGRITVCGQPVNLDPVVFYLAPGTLKVEV